MLYNLIFDEESLIWKWREHSPYKIGHPLTLSKLKKWVYKGKQVSQPLQESELSFPHDLKEK